MSGEVNNGARLAPRPVKVAITNYRSIQELRMEPRALTLVTGSNGVGKSNLYRSLELLQHAARGQLARAVAAEGGLPSMTWAGLAQPRSRAARSAGTPVQGQAHSKSSRVSVGIAFDDDAAFELELGVTVHPEAFNSPFSLDPEVKREWLWHGSPRSRRNTSMSRKGTVVDLHRRDADLVSLLEPAESMLSQVRDPSLASEAPAMRERLAAFRFYHQFRTDPESPLRHPRVGVRTPVLASDGSDLAAALLTILEIGDEEAVRDAVRNGLDAELRLVDNGGCHFEILLEVPGMLRPLTTKEFSDGSLRYLALVTALHSPRPAPTLVFNEPEASLHPALLAPLAESFRFASSHSQVWVITHSAALRAALSTGDDVADIVLERDEEEGATRIAGQGLLDVPAWP
jgi:predicted ATPase